MNSRVSFCLFVLLALDLVLGLPQQDDIGRRGEGRRRRRTRGRGLDKCKPVKPMECMSRRFSSLTVPHFFVDDYSPPSSDEEVDGTDGNGRRDDCARFVPASAEDFELGNIVNSVSNICETTENEVVRVCYMRKRDTRVLLAGAGLQEDEVDDLDLSDADLTGFRYKGRCFVCERDADNVVQDELFDDRDEEDEDN